MPKDFLEHKIICVGLFICFISIIIYDNYQIKQLKKTNETIMKENNYLKTENIKYLSTKDTLTTKFKIIKILTNYAPNNEESYIIITHYKDSNNYIVKINNNLLETKLYEDNSPVIDENQYYSAQFVLDKEDKIPYNDITTLFNVATLNSINKINETEYSSSKDQLCGSLNC